MNLLYQRFWSGHLVVFAVRSLIIDSDRQTNEHGGQNLREKADERKKEFLKRYGYFKIKPE